MSRSTSDPNFTHHNRINDVFIKNLIDPIFFLNFIERDATDFTYTANDFTANGSPVYGYTKWLSYAYLNGTTDYFSKADGVWDNGFTTRVVVIAAVKIDAMGATGHSLISKRYYDAVLANCLEEFELTVSAGGAAAMHVFDNSVTVAGAHTYIGRTTAAATISAGEWYLVVGRYEPNLGTSADIQVDVYKLSDMTHTEDNANDEANAGAFVAIEDPNTPVEVGRTNGATPGWYLDGQIWALASDVQLIDEDMFNVAQNLKGRLGL